MAPTRVAPHNDRLPQRSARSHTTLHREATVGLGRHDGKREGRHDVVVTAVRVRIPGKRHQLDVVAVAGAVGAVTLLRQGTATVRQQQRQTSRQR